MCCLDGTTGAFCWSRMFSNTGSGHLWLCSAQPWKHLRTKHPHPPWVTNPVLHQPPAESVFPNVQCEPSKPSLVASFWGGIWLHHLCCSPSSSCRQPQSAIWPPLLQSKQLHLPLQEVSFGPLHIPLEAEGPKMNTVFHVWSHQCWIQTRWFIAIHNLCPCSSSATSACDFLYLQWKWRA